MTLSNNSFNIYINIFLHYPEVYNSSTISRRLNLYFNDYFSNNKLINSNFSGNTYVFINSAPHNENQMAKIDIEFPNTIDESLNDTTVLSAWREYLFVYFDKQIPEIYFNFIRKE